MKINREINETFNMEEVLNMFSTKPIETNVPKEHLEDTRIPLTMTKEEYEKFDFPGMTKYMIEDTILHSDAETFTPLGRKFKVILSDTDEVIPLNVTIPKEVFLYTTDLSRRNLRFNDSAGVCIGTPDMSC